MLVHQRVCLKLAPDLRSSHPETAKIWSNLQVCSRKFQGPSTLHDSLVENHMTTHRIPFQNTDVNLLLLMAASVFSRDGKMSNTKSKTCIKMIINVTKRETVPCHTSLPYLSTTDARSRLLSPNPSDKRAMPAPKGTQETLPPPRYAQICPDSVILQILRVAKRNAFSAKVSSFKACNCCWCARPAWRKARKNAARHRPDANGPERGGSDWNICIYIYIIIYPLVI